MWLVQAELERFRNLKRQRVSFHPRANLVVGRNAQGKTNLLEAIGYLGGLRSFRGAGRPDLIRHGEESCRVSGEVEVNGAAAGEEKGARRALSFTIDRKGRSQAADGKRVELSDYLSTAPLVCFVPEDVGVVGGGPARRRRLLDRAVFELSPGYLAEYRRYHHALRQRNALLRQRAGAEDELAGWGRALAQAGSFLLARRLSLLAALAPRVARLGSELGFTAGLTLGYVPSCLLPPGEGSRTGFEEALLAGLAESRPRERAARRVLAGPHRDDLVFLHGENDLARSGSQGQKRAAVLAFKLAQAMLMGEEGGRFPLILLDDVASELDAPRREALGRLVRELPAQVFISMTGDGPGLPFEGGAHAGCVLRVDDGGVERFEMEGSR